MSDNVSILLNNGDATFQTAVTYGTGERPEALYAIDLDNDTDIDIVTANHDGASFSVLRNWSNGTFDRFPTLRPTLDPSSLLNMIEMFCDK